MRSSGEKLDLEPSTQADPGSWFEDESHVAEARRGLGKWYGGNSKWLGPLVTLLEIETNGIEPVPEDKRTDGRLYEMFFVWFSSNLNVLAFSTGTVGPAVFGLGTRDALVVALFVDLIGFIIPAYFAVFGPKLGTRSMVQSRFSWGYYGSIIPSVLNVFTLQGFLVINCIVGGQTLASVSRHLSWDVGIVLITLISLLVTFCGYRVVHWYESVAWIPTVIAFITMLAIGGKQLTNVPSSPPASAKSILSFASTMMSTDLSWCTMVADYGVYHRSDVKSLRIFLYAYFGFFISSFISHALGIAFAATATSVPGWDEGFQNGSNVGGLLHAVLTGSSSQSVRNFGNLVTVLVALSVPSICAPTMYSFGTSFMNVASWFAKIPRNVYVVISFAITIPLAIVGSTHFYAAFVDLFSIIGYWTGSFSGIVLVEHLLFRRRDFRRYEVDDWMDPRKLPLGLAAICSFFGSFALIIPCMSQVWYIGPIARAGTGDIGMFVAFASSALLYVVFRSVEVGILRNDLEGSKQ